jgi:hypothetical protein
MKATQPHDSLTLTQKQAGAFLEVTVDAMRRLVKYQLAGLKDSRPSASAPNTNQRFTMEQLTRAARMLDAQGAKSRNAAAWQMVNDHVRAVREAEKPLIPALPPAPAASVDDRLTMIETVLAQQGKTLSTVSDTLASLNRAIDYLMAPTTSTPATKSTAPVN